MFIDTHSHLNFKAYDNDREEVIKRTQKEGVLCINVGTKYETSKRAIELAQKYEGLYASVGMHPFHIKTEGAFKPLGEDFDYEKYKKLALDAKLAPSGKRGVVAIGEIGLDYYYRPKSKTKLEQFKEKQKQVFLQQLDLARDLDLPVILHCRMAHDDLIKILGAQIAVSYKEIKGVVHCFTGGIKELEQYLNLGFYIGLNGIIFKMDIEEVVKRCPLDKILVETDCPYLTPPQEENKRNEPIFVKHVIQKIAEIKKIRYEEVAEITTQNAKKLFNIK